MHYTYEVIISLIFLSIACGLSIYPDHTKPCIIGDIWSEECLKCTCGSDRKALCRPTYCQTKLFNEIDGCVEGHRTVKDCQTCTCVNNENTCVGELCAFDKPISQKCQVSNCTITSSWFLRLDTCSSLSGTRFNSTSTFILLVLVLISPFLSMRLINEEM